jgi:hypothetical protein
MSCRGSHLGIPINIKNTKFVKDNPMIDAQFRFNQCNIFREKHILLKPNYPGMIIEGSSTKFLFAMPIGNPRWPPPQAMLLTQDHMGKIQKYVFL